jgi:hypothetical protein
MKFLRHYGWCIYLGAALVEFTDCDIYNLSWWLISVPVILLENISRKSEIDMIKKDKNYDR